MQHPLRQLACEYKASGLWFPHMVGMDINQVMEKWKFVPGLQTMRFYFQGLLELFGVPNVERTAAASITLLMQMHYVSFSTDGRAHGVDADLHSRAVFLCREVMSSVESTARASLSVMTSGTTSNGLFEMIRR